MGAPDKLHDPRVKAGLYAKIAARVREFAADPARIASGRVINGVEVPPDTVYRAPIGWADTWSAELVVDVAGLDGAAAEKAAHAALDCIYAADLAGREMT